MKRTSAHISRSSTVSSDPPPAPVVAESSRRPRSSSTSGVTSIFSTAPITSAGATTIEQLRFRERDGKPSAYTRLYAQGVDLLVHKDHVYQQFGLHKSPPPGARTGKSMATATVAATTAVTTTGGHISRGKSSSNFAASATGGSRSGSGSGSPPPALSSPSFSSHLHHHSSISSGSSRHGMARNTSGSGNRNRATSPRPTSSSARSKLKQASTSTGSMGHARHSSAAASVKSRTAITERSSAKPQRRQSTIATELLNKSLKIGPAVIHSSTAATSLSQSHVNSSSTSARSPRLSITAATASASSPSYASLQRRPSTASPSSPTSHQQQQQQQQRQAQLIRRQSFQLATTATAAPHTATGPLSRSVGKPSCTSTPPSPTRATADSQQTQQPPVLVPVSRRTSSPLVAPMGADFGGMRRRPSVSPIRGGSSGGGGAAAGGNSTDDGSSYGSSGGAMSQRPSMVVRRDSKMDRLVEQITVLKNSLGLSDEDLQWKVESTKGNAFEAADRHLREAEELYDRLVYEIQLLSETPCDEASAVLVKRMKELVAQTQLIAALKPTLSQCQVDVTRCKKEMLDARIASQLELATAGASTGETEDGHANDSLLVIAQQRVDDAKQRLLQLQNQLTSEMTKLNELLVVLDRETDTLATAVARFKFLSADASDLSAAFVNILRCIPECSGDKLVTLCEQGIQTAQRFTGSRVKELKRKESEQEKTLRDIEVWKTRKEQSKEFAAEMQKQERQWKLAQHDTNAESLKLLRGLVPQDIQQLTVDALVERAATQAGGVLYTYDLALYIKQNKLLHWLVTHESDIARDNFLAVECASWFLNFTNYDIHELRAVCHVLPESFDFDKDGKKSEWRHQFMDHVRLLVKQQQRETIQAGWDPLTGTRATVALRPLSERQLLNTVYRYPTEEEIQVRIDKFELQLKRLAQKREKCDQLESHGIPAAKAEYLAIAEDARSEQLQQTFGKATLIKMRDDAKQAFQSLSKSRDLLKAEIEHAQRQWDAQTPSYSQFLDEVAKIRALEPQIRSERIQGSFPQELELKPRERAAFKKLSVEEEAEARRQELSRAIADRDKGLAEDVEVGIAAAAAAAEQVACAAAALASTSASASAEPSPRDGTSESETKSPSQSSLSAASVGSETPLSTATAISDTSTVAMDPDSGKAEGAHVASAESASFRRVKSLRVSVDVLRFLQNDFCSPRRTKSNLTLPASEVGMAHANSSASITGPPHRRPSFPKPSDDETPASAESREAAAMPRGSTTTLSTPTAAGTAVVVVVVPAKPAAPARPKSKALLALLEKQQQSPEGPPLSDSETGAARPSPVMKLDFLSELKNKANGKGGAGAGAGGGAARGFLGELTSHRAKSGDASEASAASVAVEAGDSDKPATGSESEETTTSKDGFLAELLRAAAAKKTKKTTSSETTEHESAVATDTAVAPTPSPAPPPTTSVAAPPAAPRSFLDELKAKAFARTNTL